MDKKKIIILTTGGTIEKCYSEYDGSLKNRQSRLKKKFIVPFAFTPHKS